MTIRNKALIAAVKKELVKIKARHKKNYGVAIFDVKVESSNNIIVLSGVVLSEKQRNEAFLLVKDIVKSSEVENKIKVLGNPKDKLEIGWGIIIVEVADMRVGLSEKKNIIKKSLASQALKGDFVRVLSLKGSRVLAQTCDLAIGWIDSSQIKISSGGVAKKEWIKEKIINPGEVIKKRLTKKNQNKFISFLDKYLNSKYLLGGMSFSGIDCSGLTEKFYLDVLGILLPRHSGNQALCGKKIELNAAHFGDLVYLRNKASKQAHVGVVVEKFETPIAKRQNFDNILILNARKEKGGVVIEDLSEVLKFYNLIFVKRIIKEL